MFIWLLRLSSSSVVFMHTEAWTHSPRLDGPFLPNHPNIPRTSPQTPRRRKTTPSVRPQGIKTTIPSNLSLASISWCLVSTLQLQYKPDDWQVHLIHQILQGYDSIFCAGTGYGKSLIFEGLAILGGKGGLVIIISPLKALEHGCSSSSSPLIWQCSKFFQHCPRYLSMIFCGCSNSATPVLMQL